MYKVYPAGYDPQIASGMPGKDQVKAGITWSQEDVDKHRELEQQYTISPTKVVWQWCEKLYL